jgi:hypothetical protein
MMIFLNTGRNDMGWGTVREKKKELNGKDVTGESAMPPPPPPTTDDGEPISCWPQFDGDPNPSTDKE